MTAPNIIAAYMDRHTERNIAAACRAACEGQDIPTQPQFPRPHLSAMNTDKPVLRLSYIVWGITAALWAYPAVLLVSWVVQHFGRMW